MLKLIVVILAMVLNFSCFAAREPQIITARSLVFLQQLINPPTSSVKNIWLGGDVATSIELTSQKYLWLFGDSVIGTNDHGVRKVKYFIHNSVGIMRYDNHIKRWLPIHKYYRVAHGKPTALFKPRSKQEFYWVTNGLMLSKKLLLVANRLGAKKLFDIKGTDIILVDNPQALPNKWRYQTYHFPNANANWAMAVVKYQQKLYFFGQRGTGPKAKTLLAMISLAAANKAQWQKMHFYSKPIQGLPGTSETSIVYQKNKGWICLQIPVFTYQIHLYTAAKLIGSWRDAGVVYQVPAKWRDALNSQGQHIFIAYAAKLHPQLSKKDNVLVLTYNINLNPFVKGLNHYFFRYLQMPQYYDLYVPQFVGLVMR
jgi:hypothetical protein